MLSKLSPQKSQISWTMKISKRSGITCNRCSSKSKRPAKSLKSKANTRPFSWRLWRKSTRMSTLSQPHKRKRNLTRTRQPPSIPWDKSLRTKSYPSSMQSSRNSLKTRKTTPQEKRKNNSNPNLNRNPILTTMMRTKVIGDPMISWSEESISWKRRKKPRMMMKSQASKNRNQNTFIKRMKKRRKSSTCPKTIKRKR